MKSRYADEFNHDDQAEQYDLEVADESHPIRAGYRQALDWLGAQVPNGSRVLDLGTGTGNTILALPENCQVTAVDISEKMLAQARVKLPARNVEYVHDDILGFFNRNPWTPYDAVVSSYALHHLTDPEKSTLFSYIRTCLTPTGSAVFVDLMYLNLKEKENLLGKYRNNPDVCESIREEFFWDVERSVRQLIELGFTVGTQRFSELSFGITATLSKPGYKDGSNDE